MNISFSSQYHMGSPNFSYRSNSNLSKKALANKENPKRHDVINKSNILKSNANTCLGRKLNKNNLLENLMEQKMNLIDSKNAFIDRSLKNGKDPKSIKEKIQSIEKQIEEIDKQINKLQLEDKRKGMGIDNKNKKSKKPKQKSNSTLHNSMQPNKSMDSILNLSTNLSKTEDLLSQRNLMSGKARVLDCEIKTDENRGINPIRKRERLAKIKDSIEDITEKFGNTLKDVNNKTKNSMKDNTYNNCVNNKQREKSKINEDIKNADKLLIKQQQAAQKIKIYSDNINYKDNYNGEKINIVS